MIIKKLREGDECPLFYAPFYYSHSKKRMSTTIIGLNLIFYFLVEFYISFKGFGLLIMRRDPLRIRPSTNEKEKVK